MFDEPLSSIQYSWLVVVKGIERVTDPDDPRIVEVYRFSWDADDPDSLDEIDDRAAFTKIGEKYRLWPKGEYRILSGGGSEEELTPELLDYIQG
ncbi:MAG: hypothetical protein ABIJ92_02570 [Candidatus Aenigmatarchaeota archaeon]